MIRYCRLMLVLLVLVLIVPGTVFCEDEQAAEAPPQAAEAPPQTTVPFDTPMAKLGDEVVSLGFFYQYTRGQLPNVDQMNDDERVKALGSVLERVFFERLAAKRMLNSGIKDEVEYQVRMMDMEADWLTRFYVYHQFFQTFKPDEEDLKKMYDERKEDFHEPAKFSFRHIFFQTIERPEEVQKLALERAQKAMALIKAGSDFVKVAQMYSDSARKGELIGPRTTRKDSPDDAINPMLEEALLTLKPGEISDIVQTKYGYEILRLESLTEEKYAPLASVRNKLMGELRQQKLEEWTKNLVESNWKEAVTVYNPELILKEDADPNAVIFEIYGRKVTVETFDFLRGAMLRQKPDEGQEDFNQRRLDDLKDRIAARYILSQKARELDYASIPGYQLLTGIEETKSVFNVWWQRTSQKEVDDQPLTDEEKKAFFDENSERFKNIQHAHLGVMTFTLPTHNKDVPYEAYKAQSVANEQAERAIARVQEGEDFAKVAAEMSADKNWDLGIVSIDDNKLPRMVAQQGISLATETVISKPLKQDDIYYVVKCFEKPERELQDYNDPEVQTKIETGLKSQKRAELRERSMKEIADPEKIEIVFQDMKTFQPQQLGPLNLDVPEKK